jgi:hypothetical protein
MTHTLTYTTTTPSPRAVRRSQVSGAGGAGVVDNICTSYGMFIRRLQDPIIENRISMATHLPIAHQEDIQVSILLSVGHL